MRHMRIYISKNGNTNLFDPNSTNEYLLKALVPDFKTQRLTTNDHTPYLQVTRSTYLGIEYKQLKKLKPGQLKGIHDITLMNANSQSGKSDGATLLDLKAEIAKRELKSCQLCGNNCQVNRFRKSGKCHSGIEAHYVSAYIHLAEESIINPALAINLDSNVCGLDCCFCQSRGITETNEMPLMPLDASLWSQLSSDMSKVAAIEFAGGSPDENVYAILEFLKKAPPQIPQIVSNCHLFANEMVYKLWDGVIDIYVTDFKFGNDKCAKALAGIKDYVHVAKHGLTNMVHQAFVPRIIVRLLVLPSHVECCAAKILEILTPFKERILLNVMDQYVPEYKILKNIHPELNRRVRRDEMSSVVAQAKERGFILV